MRALVTGSAGFVGRHFVQRLTRDGWSVDQVDIVEGFDAIGVFEVAGGYDLLVHAAANVGGRAKIDGDPLWIAHNLAIDEAAFRWAVRTGTRVLYFSSSAAYPIHLQTPGQWRLLPLAEKDINAADGFDSEADSVYGTAKRMGEYLARHARAEGVPVHVVRPFSGYGTDQALDYPFPSFVDRAKRYADPFDIWGDGTQTRDFIHIDDIVEACLKIIDADCQEPVNLCTGVPTSFLELQAAVCAAVGYAPTVQLHPDKPTGVHYRVGDPTFLHHFHTPRISLAEGILRAVTA